MNIHSAKAKALVVALGALSLAPLQASAQSIFSSPKSTAEIFASITPDSGHVPDAAFRLGSAYQSRQSWGDLALAAGAVALVGILSDNGTLTVIGVAGVVLCLVENQQSHYFRLTSAGFEMVNAHGFTAGLTPFGMTNPQHGPTAAGYVGYGFRF
ncbi:MAG TPA: hypothetical protein VMI31_17840 [Fimbriimonadaceae bacterium]|nr:hypothetical protein [Fimbriimonadaceae bacterium]